MNRLPADDDIVQIGTAATVAEAVIEQKQDWETLDSVIMRGMLALQEQDEPRSPLATHTKPPGEGP